MVDNCAITEITSSYQGMRAARPECLDNGCYFEISNEGIVPHEISRTSLGLGPQAAFTGTRDVSDISFGTTALVVDNSVITGITMVITFGLSYRLVDIQ